MSATRSDVPVPAPRRRGRAQRRELPLSAEDMRDALAVARRVEQVEARLRAIRVERRELVLRLRRDGLSQLEVAELLGVTKARVQQIERERP